MKIILITIISLSLSSIAFAECSDEEKVEMLNAGVSAKYIKKYCEEFSDSNEISKNSEMLKEEEEMMRHQMEVNCYLKMKKC